jgi:hypothetical protein
MDERVKDIQVSIETRVVIAERNALCEGEAHLYTDSTRVGVG